MLTHANRVPAGTPSRADGDDSEQYSPSSSKTAPAHQQPAQQQPPLVLAAGPAPAPPAPSPAPAKKKSSSLFAWFTETGWAKWPNWAWVVIFAIGAIVLLTIIIAAARHASLNRKLASLKQEARDYSEMVAARQQRPVPV
jgi:hypothetical protein